MNIEQHLTTIDFDELKEICLSKSGASTEFYLSLIYYLATGEVGHNINYQVHSGIKFNLLPNIKNSLNIQCETINMLSHQDLRSADITLVKDRPSAIKYITSFHPQLNEEALEWSFNKIEYLKILIEQDNLENKIKSLRKDKNEENSEVNKNKFKL